MATEQQLLAQILSKDVLNEQDKQWLLGYLESADTSALQLLLQERYSEDLKAAATIEAGISRQLWADISAKTEHQNRQIKPAALQRFTGSRMRWVAASVLVLLTSGIIWYRKTNTFNQSIPDRVPITANTINAGKDGAVLTLANGKQVLLDTIKNGVIALQGGSIAKVVNGSLVYEGSSDAILYNTMSTPKGRQFRLTLPDGTAVWLNSASSIHFPTAFNGKERRVNITGEAYFEVAAHASQPFKVAVNDRTNITVLGTWFNINAYANEENIAATLLQGSIQVNDNNNSVLLQPNQQARITPVNPANAIRVLHHVDTDKVIAWKNGLFNFENASFAEIMRQLERWYDIEVVYESTIPAIALKGEITRDVPLDQLLTAMKKMGVHYKLEGRQLTIQP